MVGTSNQSVPEMVIDHGILPSRRAHLTGSRVNLLKQR